MRIPILKDILGGTEETILSTDIVILLTPRIVRTHELTQEHLNPIYIGSQMNLGLSGPSPVIGADPLPAAPPEPAVATPPLPPPPGQLPINPSPTTGAGVTSTPGVAPVVPAPRRSDHAAAQSDGAPADDDASGRHSGRRRRPRRPRRPPPLRRFRRRRSP